MSNSYEYPCSHGDPCECGYDREYEEVERTQKEKMDDLLKRVIADHEEVFDIGEMHGGITGYATGYDKHHAPAAAHIFQTDSGIYVEFWNEGVCVEIWLYLAHSQNFPAFKLTNTHVNNMPF